MSNDSRRIEHKLTGTTHTYRPDMPAYDAAADVDSGTLVVAPGMPVTVLSVFRDWNGVSGLDMMYAYCHETGLCTHVTPSDLGVSL